MKIMSCCAVNTVADHLLKYKALGLFGVDLFVNVKIF